MTNKITREEAETLGRIRGYKYAFVSGLTIDIANYEMERDEVPNRAEELYMKEITELAPRIITESPWRPIEECPRESGKQYLIEFEYYSQGKWYRDITIGRYNNLNVWGLTGITLKGYDRLLRYAEIPRCRMR